MHRLYIAYWIYLYNPWYWDYRIFTIYNDCSQISWILHVWIIQLEVYFFFWFLIVVFWFTFSWICTIGKICNECKQNICAYIGTYAQNRLCEWCWRNKMNRMLLKYYMQVFCMKKFDIAYDEKVDLLAR